MTRLSQHHYLPLRVGCLLDPPVEVDPQQHHSWGRHQQLGHVYQVRPEEGERLLKP